LFKEETMLVQSVVAPDSGALSWTVLGSDDAGESSLLVQAAWQQHASPPSNRRMGAGNVQLGPDNPLVRSAAVIALLEVTGCHHSAECVSGRTRELCNPWAVHGQYHIEVKVRAELTSPVSCAGRQKLWALPGGVVQAARARLPAT
jgi:hypothetical protein